jgi:hypothetical protein
VTYARKVVLHCPRGYRIELNALVEDFLANGVAFVAVVGEDCSRVEDIVDELVVGDGTDEKRFILTSSHPGETVAQAVEFAKSLSNEYAGQEVQVVEL